MKNNIKIIVRLVILCFTIQSQAQDKQTIMKEKGISISNFNAEHISDEEIKVSVDYSYVGETDPKKKFIYAFPQDGEGNSMSRNVDTELIPLKIGNNQVSFTIKKRLKIENFISHSIKLCMLEIKREIYCQEFSYKKSWKESSSPIKIIAFNSNKTQVNIGEPVTLTWQTENATRITILQPGTRFFHGSNEASGNRTVKPIKTTTYVLKASKSSKKGVIKQESRRVTITVNTNTAPEIVDFRIEPQEIERGEQVRFYWQINNAQKIQLFDSFGEIMSDIQHANEKHGKIQNLNGEYMENLNKTETYILKATNDYGSVKKIVKVTVRGKKID